jgi:hypothetical protein
MYLQFDDDFNILPATTKIVFNPILQQFVQTVPIIIGLTFFCISYFGMCWRFNSFDKGLIMLWANWNGDELQNMWHNNLYAIKVIMGPFVLYCWIWLSNNLIQNSFLAIIADGYIEQTKVGMFDWLEDGINDP